MTAGGKSMKLFLFIDETYRPRIVIASGSWADIFMSSVSVYAGYELHDKCMNRRTGTLYYADTVCDL